jgi:hypothetical protein
MSLISVGDQELSQLRQAPDKNSSPCSASHARSLKRSRPPTLQVDQGLHDQDRANLTCCGTQRGSASDWWVHPRNQKPVAEVVVASPLVRANAVAVNDVLEGDKLLEIDSFFTAHEHNPIPSPALLDRRGQAFRRAVLSFAEANDIPVLALQPRPPGGLR